MENKNFTLNIESEMELTGYPSIDKTHLRDAKFIEKHPIIPNVNIYSAFKLMSTPYQNDSAINCLDLNATYKELLEDSITLSKAFRELGIKKGDIITVSMPNFYQAVTTFFAANRIGAVTTFLNSFAGVDEIKRYLNEFESPLFINYDKADKYNNSIKKGTSVQNIITLYRNDLNKKGFALERSNPFSTAISYYELGSLSRFQRGICNNVFGGNDDALILFTSGTTGNPKSVLLTNKNILSSAIYMKNSTHLENTRGEKSLVCVPFTYPYGFATSTLMSLLCGRQAILAPNLSKDNISYYLEKNPNIIFGSPALLELIKRNVPEDFDLSSIDTFISGGDFLTVKQNLEGKEFFEKHNASVLICNGSGNAETVGASTNAVGIPLKPETVGKVLVGSDVIIIDEETGKELKYGEEGLLCISGGHVFKGYYNNPELTEKEKFEYKGKTYFKTGTRGILDPDGYFTLTGRNSRYYIISTLNKIYCDYVQNVISNIDIIDSVAVVKKQDDERLYTSKAFIVLKDGIENDEVLKDYILSKCEEELVMESGDKIQLKPYEIPTSIEFITELPRTKADKIDYACLERLAADEYEMEKVKVYKKR